MIRTQIQINAIINQAQQALAGIGPKIIEAAGVGVENTDVDQRDRILELEAIRAILQVILTPDGDIVAYFTAPVNEKMFNSILDGLAALSRLYSGPFIPMLGTRNIPLVYYPSGSSGGGSQPVTPGGTTFQNLSVDSPGEIIDQFDANISSFAYYIYSVQGQNVGEGNRSGFFILSWKGSTVSVSGDAGTSETGGDTDNVFFTAAIVSGKVQLTCNVPTNNWKVQGLRILFQNSSYSPQQGEFPNGVRTDTAGLFWGVKRLDSDPWNMDTTDFKDISYVGFSNVIVLGVEIIANDGTRLNLNSWSSSNDGTYDGGFRVSSTFSIINLRRKPGGVFDQASFNNAQAIVTIMYTL